LVSKLRRLVLLAIIVALAFGLQPKVHASPITVAVAPASQIVSEYSMATFSIGLSAPVYPNPPNPDLYSLSLSGFPSGVAFGFSSNPVAVPAGGVTVTLTIDASDLCPGTYSLSVSASSSPTSPPDTGSTGIFSLTVTPVGPPLRATVSSDKPSYRLGDRVTVLFSVNKPAYGRLTISPPSGTPRIFDMVLAGATQRTFNADTVGRWTVTFEANVCSEFDSAVVYFDVAPDTYDASISLSGIPPQLSANVQVDGQPQGAMAGSEIRKLSFKVDTSHTISVDQYVSGDPGVRYYCAQNTWTVGSAGSRTFEYETQYLLTVGTDPEGVAQVTGGGWFKAGTSAQTSQAPQTLTGSAGTQYVFKGWEVDGVLQPGNAITLTMDKPHEAVAKYQTQYQLVVDSEGGLGSPQGSGYYDAGSTAQFSVTSPVGLLIQQVFVQWTGDYRGTSPQGSIVMDGPKHVMAEWETSYTQLYMVLAAVAAVIIIAGLLLWRRRRAAAVPEMKPTPPMPSEAEAGPPPAEGAGEAPAPETVTCASCGTNVPAGQQFCHNCGAKIG